MLLFPSLLAASLVSAAPPAPVPPATVLSGHLAHAPAGDSVRVEVGGHRYATALSATGDFRLTIKRLAAPAPADFYCARQHAYLYLTPGDQLRLTLDFPNFDETLAFSGRGAAPNNYLAQWQWKFRYGPEADSLRPENRRTPATTPAQMRQLADRFRQRQLTFLARYPAPLAPAFRQRQATGLAIDWGAQLLDYVGYHREQVPGEAVPEAYFGFMKELPIAAFFEQMAPDQADFERTFHLLYNYQDRLAPSGTLGTDPATAGRLYALAQAELGTVALRDRAVYRLLNWKVDTDLPGVLAAYPTFRRLNQDSTYAHNLHTVLARRVLLGVGKPAPAFALRDNNGREVALKDLRGKIIYLDFWGTWCPPCLKEMTEFSHDLKQKFEGRDVVFVYISANDAEAKWQQVITNQHFTSANSVHLYQPKGGQVTTDYQINGFPSYWLIGRDGRILDMQAPRPSEGAKTVAAIEAALQQ